MGDGTPVAHFGPFNAQSLGLTVDAFTRGTLVVDSVIKRSVTIQQSAHQSTFLPIGILDAAFAFGELGVLTGRSCAGRKEQGAAKALRNKAVGVPKLKEGSHTQA